MYKPTVLNLVVGVAIWLTLIGVACAADSVPFKGEVAGEAVSTAATPPPLVLVDFSGTGNASHLGKFTANAEYFLNPTVFPTKLTVTDGVFTFIAANGDSIHGVFNGQGQFTGDPNVITLDATATITGGTGRFAGATGSFRSFSIVDLLASRIRTVFDGVVSTPGSNKK